MEKKEYGILEKEGIYFHEASDFARGSLPYVQWGASYRCDAPYRVERANLDSFILLHICEGALFFEYRGETVQAKQHETILLDCKYENIYYAKAPVAFHWMHINGGIVQDYVDRLYQNQGFIFASWYRPYILPHIEHIMGFLKSGTIDDDRTASHLLQLFAELVSPRNPVSRPTDAVISAAAHKMEQFPEEITSVSEVAQSCNLSLYYFTRCFKQYIGTPPHQYLLRQRILRAKQLLTESSLSIERVGERCGFHDTSHFIRSFRQSVGMTPGEFRALGF